MAETRWLDADEQQAWRAFLTAAHLVLEAVDCQLQRDSGLSRADYEVLVRLSEAPQRSLRMSELSDRTLFSRSRLSHAVARLERQGLVARSSCSSDRRGTFATLTDPGFAALAAAAPGHVETVRRVLLDPLTPTHVEQLRVIATAVQDKLFEPSPTGEADPTTGDMDQERSS